MGEGEKQSREASQEAYVMLKENKGWWFRSDRKNGSGQKFGKSKLRGFPAGLNEVHEKKKEAGDGSRYIRLSSGKNGIASVSGQRTGIQFWVCQASNERQNSNRDVEWQLDR